MNLAPVASQTRLLPIAPGKQVGSIGIGPDDFYVRTVHAREAISSACPLRTLGDAQSAAEVLSRGDAPAVLVSRVSGKYLLNRVEWVEAGDTSTLTSKYFSAADLARVQLRDRRAVTIIDA